ncbi:glycosyltransferase [Paenibacillus vini]|uniref:glycosyltransferase n=1 Tax=Paenibacillus vini TaxID=1476024 RepID=UPI0025B68995|nr:glycosyltransferase [Paenibacillus vini]MDN4066521.1 glycosyltransferase [Paenibacillus vini]
MSSPVVSVCIPVYNAECFITQTINSVLAQTFQDFEIIIVDNASTDNTMMKIRKFKDDRIKVYSNKNNIGMVANWNKCLTYSSGEYVKFLCADDLMLPGLLERQVDVLNKNPKVSLVSSGSYIINEENKVVAKRMKIRNDGVYTGEKMARKSLRIGNIFGEPTTVMFRKDTLDATGPFDLNYFYAPDWDMWLKLMYVGDFYFIHDYLSKFRVSKSSTTTNIMFKKGKEMIRNDKLLLMSHKAYSRIKISKSDEIIHYINLIKSFILKAVFLKFVV